MEKIDVMISSFKKPESLIFTVLSLKKHCGEFIDTIYIDDNSQKDGTVDYYKTEKFIKAVEPIKIKVRENKKYVPCGLTGFTKNFLPLSLKQLKSFIKTIVINNNVIFDENDIRYQWGINTTDKKFLFIIHDDIEILDNIVELYFKTFQENEKCAIVGDLGQCWKCEESNNCSPERIMQGHRPHEFWPLTKNKRGKLPHFYYRFCRINEWCCMLNVDITRKLTNKYRSYFGNFEDKGDIGSVFFANVIKSGYDFADPLPKAEDRDKFYKHCWQGHSGYSVWVDQGWGIKTYNREMIKKRLKNEFGFEFD